MERILASIRTITDVRPIPNADAIELAIVGGWQVIIKKNEFVPGDKCVYCEIDSFLPEKPEFEFLRKSSYKTHANGSKGFRLRTIKLRGQLSQGLVLPVSVLPKDFPIDVGADVSTVMDIILYEQPIPVELAGQMLGGFPSFLRRTDEERIQNLTGSLEEFSEKTWFVTEKLDGTSATFYIKNGKFGVCSRNIELKETDGNIYWRLARDLHIEPKLRSLEKNICLQGELIGPGIQGNKYELKTHTVKFFNIYDIDDDVYYDVYDMHYHLEMLELDRVPFLYMLEKAESTTEYYLTLAEGASELNPKQEREGLVFRSADKDLSFKVINNKFLLNNE